jgi:ferrochelatase
VASVLDAPLTTTIPEEDPSVGILLLNLGGPETSSDVEGFLFNLFKDPDIIRLPPLLAPLQPLIAFIISKRRAPQSRAAYDSIGGGSPILEYSHAQGRLLCEQLAKQYNMRAQYFIGMRYWYPFTEQALSDIVAPNSKIRALVVVPLYPHFSISTTGSSLRQVQKEWSLNPSKYQRLYHTVVPSWHLRPGYVAAMVDLIKHELDQFTPAQLEEATKSAPNLATRHVLFSAHGVPVSYIEAGDPYQLHIQQGVEAIAALLPEDVQIHTSYQSRVGPIEWLRVGITCFFCS